eukprot:TRINITY_DN38231_c0_g2_i1.p1 TRINITY_DN38231_c0_g2~~TRINITY_DN38231_c0_g2_i1.p1  ORF type:complete len:552 (+),score=31.32 TRINITY_DN38231_c0_g2_i1:79-1656(+)
MGCSYGSQGGQLASVGPLKVGIISSDPKVLEVKLWDGMPHTVGLASDSLVYCMLAGCGDGAVFLDGRKRTDYDKAHLYSSRNLDALMQPANAPGVGSPTLAENSDVFRPDLAWEAALRSLCNFKRVIVCGYGSVGTQEELDSDEDVKLVLHLLRYAGVKPKEPALVVRNGISGFSRRFQFCLRSTHAQKPLPACPAEILSPLWGGSAPGALYLMLQPPMTLPMTAGADVRSVMVHLGIGVIVVAGTEALQGASSNNWQGVRVLHSKTTTIKNGSLCSREELEAACVSQACVLLSRQRARCLLCGSAAPLVAALFIVHALPQSPVISVDEVAGLLRQRCPQADLSATARQRVADALLEKYPRPPAPPVADKASPQVPSTAQKHLPTPASKDPEKLTPTRYGVAPTHNETRPDVTLRTKDLCRKFVERDAASAATALKTLATALKNIKDSPAEPKYRRLKGSNERVQRDLLRHPEIVEILELVGWWRSAGGTGAGKSGPPDFEFPTAAPLEGLTDVLSTISALCIPG